MLIKSKISPNQSERGQALLVVVLITVIVLAVGLAAISRTVTNLRNSAQEASSQKALSAAEAGIEQAIKSGTNQAGNFGAGGTVNSSFDAKFTPVLSDTFLINNGNTLSKDDGVYIWLTPNTALFAPPFWNGRLNIYWGSASDSCNSTTNTAVALEIAVIKGPKTAPTTQRFAADDIRCTRSNGFTKASTPSPQYSGQSFANRYQIDITNGLLIRIIPLYGSTVVGVSKVSGPPLPAQGTVVRATGTSDTTKRTVEAYQSFSELPTELFPYSLFVPK